MQVSPAIADAARALSNWSWAQTISSTWLFPFFETLHVFGLTALLGSIALVDLRLLGLVNRNHAVTALSEEVLPWTWGGFVLAMGSGVLIFMGGADHYVSNAAFQLKMLLLVLAGANMAVFHLVAWRSVGRWDNDASAPIAARIAGALSLLFWIGVVACGRWIAFVH